MKLSIYSFLFEYYDIILDYSQVYVIIFKLVWNYNVAFSFSSSSNNNSSNCLFLLLFMFNSSTSAINISSNSNSNSIDDVIVINIQRKISQSLLQFNTVDTCVGIYSLWLSKYVNVNSNMYVSVCECFCICKYVLL